MEQLCVAWILPARNHAITDSLLYNWSISSRVEFGVRRLYVQPVSVKRVIRFYSNHPEMRHSEYLYHMLWPLTQNCSVKLT